MSISFDVTRVKELMTPNPAIVSPSATLQQAAKKMAESGCSVLPVGTKDRLNGVITDRDIVHRAIAKGRDPAHEKVSGYMTKEIYTCNENDSLEAAAEKMHRYKVRRLLVSDGEGRTTGILSFDSILRNDASPAEVACCIKHAAGPVSVFREKRTS